MLKIGSFDFNTLSKPLRKIVYDGRSLRWSRTAMIISSQAHSRATLTDSVDLKTNSRDLLLQDGPHGKVHRAQIRRVWRPNILVPKTGKQLFAHRVFARSLFAPN